ncbi:MAG TPA: isoprenylcysteine carboxylmethyltransferase family protein [Dehalococcoidia bacterium]|nr:isoprenylcysteine carboxylmethyltransferase family protein [Dehalococcoidia bacterium]
MSLIPAFEIGVLNAWIFMIWLVIQNFGIRLIGKELYQRAGDPPDMKASHMHKIASYISMPLWLLTTAYSIFLPLQLATIWFYIGLAIFLLGLIMNIFATINFATTPMAEPVIKGVYSYSRHPIYIAILLIYLSVGIASASWIFLLVVIIWAVLVSVSATDEERYCLKKYGEAYHDYMNRTPRWVGIPKSEAK